MQNTSTAHAHREWLRLAKQAVEASVTAADPKSPAEADRLRSVATLAQLNALLELLIRYAPAGKALAVTRRIARGCIHTNEALRVALPVS